MRLLFILMLFVYFVSCDIPNKNTKYLFYEGYSQDMHKGLAPIDTIRSKIQNFAHEYYFMEELINDSISNIYLIQNKKKNYFDTAGCEITTKQKNAQSIIYVGKINDVFQSTEKNLVCISAYYEKDTVDFTLDELVYCAPKYGVNSQVEKLSGTLISRGAAKETFYFCLPTIDTINLIEHFKTFEKFNFFRLKLKQTN